MSPSGSKSLLDRMLSTAITLLVVVLMLSWAWSLLKPLLPVLAVGFVLIVLGRYWLNRWRF